MLSFKEEIEARRKEESEVKGCFNNFAFQTLIICVSILSFCAVFFSNSTFFQNIKTILIFIADVFIVLFCDICMAIGTHKFNTSNRSSAWEIHLSRIEEYKNKYIKQKKRVKQFIAQELAKIDWEEAMFAFRVVQPVIFKYFYREKIPIPLLCKIKKLNELLGTYFKRFKKKSFLNSFFKDEIDKIISSEFYNSIQNYPWYDTREIISLYKKNAREIMLISKKNIIYNKNSMLGQFYPGTYLKRMLILFSIFSLIINILILFLPFFPSNPFLKKIFLSACVIFLVYNILNISRSFTKCNILIWTSFYSNRSICMANCNNLSFVCKISNFL